MTALPERIDIFGTRISLTSVDEVVDLVLERTSDTRVVVIANVHSVMTARRHTDLARIFNDADVATPDGVPLVWALKAWGHDSAIRVTGIDVMTKSFDLGRKSRARHFFYGSTEYVLNLIEAKAHDEYPGIIVAGRISPPFHDQTDVELHQDLENIKGSDADVVWVCLGMPKQERWMRRASKDLPGVSFVGVGAAFDWFARTTPRAPAWMQDNGLEWAYRLGLEPRRMWRRYAYNNPAFLALLARSWLQNLGRRRPD